MSHPNPTLPIARQRRSLLPRNATTALPWLVGAVALGAVIAQVVFFSLTIVRQKQSGPVALVTASAPPSLSLTPALSALFGSQPAPAGAEVPSSRPLVLTAVIATGDPSRGFGIIGETAQLTAMYAVGASLPDGARLIEVYAEHVVLDRGGQRETLYLPRPALGAGSGIRMERVESASAEQEPSAAEQERRRQAEADEYLTSRGRAKLLARSLGIDEEQPSTGLTLRPSSRYQRTDGMRIGDVVVSVNGRSVNDVHALVDALSGTIDGGGAMVVRRHGELVTLSLQPEY